MADKEKSKKSSTEKDDLLREARKRADKAITYSSEDKKKAVEDIEFLDGENQWTTEAKAARQDRPCLTINKLPAHLDQVEGEQRKNRTSIKVSPVDSMADPKTADVIAGIFRNIEYISKAYIAYNNAFSGAASSGYGAFRIITAYVSDDSFEQEIRIEEIEDPLSIEWDPEAKKQDRSDAKYCFIYQDVDREEFKKEYPDINPIDFEKSKDGDMSSWCTQDTVRIAEYFRKKPIKKKIHQLDDGSIVEELREGQVPVKTREVISYKVEWYKITGDDIIDGPKTIPGNHITIIPVWGKKLLVKGKRRYRGLVRNAKDPQRLYNYERSSYIETVALTPKSPFMLTPTQVKGHESQWKRAFKEVFAYLLYNNDPKAPQKPYREPPPQIPSGHVQSIVIADKELNDTTGVPEAMRGVKSNERSGKALIERKRQGNTGSYVYIDNLAIAVEHAGRVIVDMIPHIYDTARVIRIRNESGKGKSVTINEKFTDKEGNEVLYDLTTGKYDVVVSVGPSYATQRAEAADSLTSFVQAVPSVAPAIMDLIAKYSDWPGSEEMSKRLEKMLPPELRDIDDEDNPNASGPQGSPPSNEPSPVELLQVAQEEEKLKGLQIDNQIKEAKLNQEEAQIKALVAEMMEKGEL